MDSVKLLSPAVLAFVGDAQYSLLVRDYLAHQNLPTHSLHENAVKFVSASAQAKSFEVIKPFLSEEELSVFTRGRNHHTSNTPKSSNPVEYHTATGFECLFGFLHLSDKSERIKELFEIILKEKCG